MMCTVTAYRRLGIFWLEYISPLKILPSLIFVAMTTRRYINLLHLYVEENISLAYFVEGDVRKVFPNKNLPIYGSEACLHVATQLTLLTS